MISPDAEKAIEQLQAKIKGMETAKVVGAFLTALLFFASKEVPASRPRAWYPWVAGAGLALLAVAAIPAEWPMPVLVAYSGAGSLLPSVAQRLRVQPSTVVFVDPPPERVVPFGRRTG